MSNNKFLELTEEIREYNIICVTETQQREEKFNHLKDNIQITSSHRGKEDMKGGGLMIINVKENITVEKLHSDHPDVLYVEMAIAKYKFRIVLVYMASGNEPVKIERNIQIKKCIESKIEESKELNEDLMVLGDFNGHIRFLGAQQ